MSPSGKHETVLGGASPEPDYENNLGTEALVADRYRVIERLGQGGMGSVYLAEHVHMKKEVALKVLHRELTRQPEAVARFEREAVAAGRIDHPNVAQATDFGRLPDGSFFLVLEYVKGNTLSRVLAERALAEGEALEIARQVSEALSAAHTAGIVHRDLKPDNIMLVERPNEPDLVKVLDFGIAKLGTLDQSATRTPITRMGSVFGTPEYMAPEQAAGGAVDLRADLYSLGVLLYRMLAGREPFIDQDVSKILMQQVTQPPPPLPLSLSPKVRRLVADLLEKDPAHRIQTADEVYARIVYCQLQHTVQARAGWLDRARASAEVLRFKLQQRAGLLNVTRGSGQGAWVKALGQVLWVIRGKQVTVLHAVFALGFLGLVSLAVWVGAPGPAVPSPGSLESHSLSGNGLNSTVLADAIAGDSTAISTIEERPASQRSVEEWWALAQGRAALGRFSGAIEAYQEGLLRAPQLSKSPELAHDLWRAAQRPDVAEQALRFAARNLGSLGADLLYKVWVDLSRSVTSTTALAKELLYTPVVLESATPALRVALELRAAETCDAVAPLLPGAMLYGDARSVRVLRRVQTDLECEAHKAQLDAAIAKVKDRPEPRF